MAPGEFCKLIPIEVFRGCLMPAIISAFGLPDFFLRDKIFLNFGVEIPKAKRVDCACYFEETV